MKCGVVCAAVISSATQKLKTQNLQTSLHPWVMVQETYLSSHNRKTFKMMWLLFAIMILAMRRYDGYDCCLYEQMSL